MRVGILTQWYDPEPGPAALPAALARGLVARGHDVQVVTGFPNYPTGRIEAGYRLSRRMDEVRDDVRLRRVALVPGHGGSKLGRIVNYGSFAVSAIASGMSALRDVDVLWVNYSPVTIGLPMFAQIRRQETPTVLHVLDLWPDTLFATGFATDGVVGKNVKALLDRWCDRMYRRAQSVAYISPGVGKVLAERGVPVAKLEYAPMWADEHVFKPVPAARDRSSWGLGPDTVALVYAGSLGRVQDLSTLVEAMTRVGDLDVQCLIAGSGTEEASLRELAAVNPCNVRFLGRVPPTQMPELMAASDVHYAGLNAHALSAVTMPSKVQTIMASQRPIIGSLEGDAAEVAERGGGWCVPPGDVDGLERVIRLAVGEGRDGLAMRGATARKTYELEFGYEAGVDRIERLLLRAVGRRR